MKKSYKQIGQWILALIVAALIMNVLLAFYHRTTGWIDRKEGSTTAIYSPGGSILMGTEGRGYHKVDSRGYVNDVDVLADNYVIAIGASYTQGKEVDGGERYTDLLNQWTGHTEDALVYNVSEDAYFFPKIARGFSALTQEFPDASKIIIETATTAFTPEALNQALDQRKFNVKQTGENIMSQLSMKKKFTMMVKEYSPLLFNINKKLNDIKAADNDGSKNSDDFDMEEYRTSLEAVFAMLTEIYDGELIILFHPYVAINEDGTMSITTKATDSTFFEVCDKYGVTVVDLSDKFLEEYEKDYTVPYGFSNTSMGRGHLNVDGHRMIAEELLYLIK